MCAGLDNEVAPRTYNLTQLCKNSRKRQNRIAGRKRPRPIDNKLDALACEVNPAPDSLFNQTAIDMDETNEVFTSTVSQTEI